MKLKFISILMILSLFVAPTAFARYDIPVEKQVFTANGPYTTVNGEEIPEVKFGYEIYGTFNADKSNVIWITHHYSGTSHAAGEYVGGSPRGYWDSIIGPGDPLDTNKYAIVAVDSIINMNPFDPMVTTTGPASINPATGEEYGMSFPIITIADMVHCQKLLAEELGVSKIQLTTGASMGGLQALEWAAQYPGLVERTMPVIAPAWSSDFLVGWLQAWGSPIRLDPNWNGGDYYDSQAPVEGLTEALRIVTLHARHFRSYDGMNRAWADPAKDPGKSWDNYYQVEKSLDAAAASRASVADANSFLYLAKACQLFAVGHQNTYQQGIKKVKCPVMLVHADENDLIYPGSDVQETAAQLRALGVDATDVELAGNYGHLNGVVSISHIAPQISAFLSK